MSKADKDKHQDKKLAKKEYEDLGRIVASIYETGYLDKATAYKTSFVKGILQGFGGVLGATVLVALLIWVLSFFNEIPLLGNIIDNLQNTVENR